MQCFLNGGEDNLTLPCLVSDGLVIIVVNLCEINLNLGFCQLMGQHVECMHCCAVLKSNSRRIASCHMADTGICSEK